MKTLLLIDGHSLAYRAFYALPITMKAPDGQSTNAIYGFLKMLCRLIIKEQPSAIAVAFDTKAPTFRHQAFPDYKGHRPPSPPEFHPQVPILKEILELLGISTYAQDGFEADDLIATLARRGQTLGYKVTAVTGDKDILQLVDEQISVRLPLKGLSVLKDYTHENIKELTGLSARQVIDYKCLKGDPSDNIKGIEGIGDKTATKLLQIAGSLTALLAQKPVDISEKIWQKIRQSADFLARNRQLVTLNDAVPLAEGIVPFRGLNVTGSQERLLQLGLRSFLMEFEQHDNGGLPVVGKHPESHLPEEQPLEATACNEQLALF